MPESCDVCDKDGPKTVADPDTLRSLYDEALVHYHECPVDRASLSDTWIQTLKHRGHLFAFEDMLQMLTPGNRVNFWIDDLHYLIDPSVLDLNDPVVKRLLEFGEPECGAPRHDLTIQGNAFSSNYIHHVFSAAKIIHAIEERKLTNPSIVEIGGGLGVLAAILRQYYGSRLTLYLVDIPETLAIQEWYLRACFPDAPTSFTASQAPTSMQRGGLNFINAYVLESHRLEFDVVVNIDSMQEMSHSTVASYIRYIEQHISDHGIVYFQNHFGHSTSSIPEPSEYPWDASWTIRTAEMAYQIECCAESEQLRLILFRTHEPEDAATRRLLLRVLWNGFVSGRIVHAPALVAELAQLPKTHSSSTVLPACERVLSSHGIRFDQSALSSLQDTLYLADAPSALFFQNELVPTRERKNLTQQHMEAVWSTQSGLLQLMREMLAESVPWPESRVNERLAALCQRQLLSLQGTEHSEYWSAYLASMLFVLRQQEAACRVLHAAAAHSVNPFWLTRFAYLFSRFERVDEARGLLERVEQYGPLDHYLTLKCAELEQRCGETAKSEHRLRILASQDGFELPRLATLARTASSTAAFEVAAAACQKIWERFPEARLAQLRTVARAARSSATKKAMDALLLTLLQSYDWERDPDETLAYATLLIELGNREKGATIMMAAIDTTTADYYRLGLAGKVLQEAGLNEQADVCLGRSLALRPDSFLHHEFVGDVYFAARRYDDAHAQYTCSLAIKPYLRHIQAKALYSALPDAGRAMVLSHPSNLPLIFQRKQDWYHDLGLSNK